jgi:signal transduction histidine kinase
VREPVDLTAELESMIEDARVLAADLRLQFHLQISPQQRIAADRALLHTALFNLISNAIKYNEPDGRVEIRREVSG